MIEFNIEIHDELGLHARPAGQIVKIASKYKSAISIKKGAQTADAKKLFSVMALGARQGEKITFTFEGDDAAEAAAEIEQFVSANL